MGPHPEGRLEGEEVAPFMVIPRGPGRNIPAAGNEPSVASGATVCCWTAQLAAVLPQLELHFPNACCDFSFHCVLRHHHYCVQLLPVQQPAPTRMKLSFCCGYPNSTATKSCWSSRCTRRAADLPAFAMRSFRSCGDLS